jgi:Flp pilus assembly protein TadD
MQNNQKHFTKSYRALNLFLSSLAVILGLSACTDGMKMPGTELSAEDAMKGIDGPDIPTVAETMNKSADAAIAKGEYTKAIQYYQQIVEKNPESVKYKYKLAEAYRRSGDSEKALALYNSMLAKNPKNLDALEGKAMVAMDRGNFGEASKLFNTVMSEDAARWRTINAAGILLALNRDIPESIEYFREALRLSPDNPTVLNNIGLTMAINKDFDGAIKAMQLASSLVADGTEQRKRIDLNAAMIYGINGDMANAENLSKKHLPDVAVYNNLGLFASLSKDETLAKSYLNKALTQSPVYYEKAWQNLEKIN